MNRFKCKNQEMQKYFIKIIITNTFISLTFIWDFINNIQWVIFTITYYFLFYFIVRLDKILPENIRSREKHYEKN